MPLSYYITYTCRCGLTYQSNHYKEPGGCPDCRRVLHALQAKENHRKHRQEGKTHHKNRDASYDKKRVGSPESVYSPQCVIPLLREVAACKFCGEVKDIINGYCALCRGNGANEPQCINSKVISMVSESSRTGRTSPRAPQSSAGR